MNQRRFHSWVARMLLVFLAMAWTACDSTSGLDEDAADSALATEQTSDFAAALSEDLSLSSSQQQMLNAVMERHGGQLHEPGFLWYVAADMQATLTEEQKERLFGMAAAYEPGVGFTGGPHGEGAGGPAFGRPGEGPGPGPGGFIDDLLTEEQRATIEAIRDAYRPQIEDLVASRRDGDLTPEAFREAMDALHEAMRAEVDAVLTEEQRATIEERRQERDAEREALRAEHEAVVRAAMSEALGLSAEQEAAIFAFLDEHRADHEALIEQFQAGGLTAEALHEALAALHEARDAFLEGVLDATQWEIVRIHDALAVRGAGPHGPRAGGPGEGGPEFGGPGQGGPGMGGMGGPRPGGPGRSGSGTGG